MYCSAGNECAFGMCACVNSFVKTRTQTSTQCPKCYVFMDSDPWQQRMLLLLLLSTECDLVLSALHLRCQDEFYPNQLWRPGWLLLLLVPSQPWLLPLLHVPFNEHPQNLFSVSSKLGISHENQQNITKLTHIKLIQLKWIIRFFGRASSSQFNHAPSTLNRTCTHTNRVIAFTLRHAQGRS